jgi:hypothetical protein
MRIQPRYSSRRALLRPPRFSPYTMVTAVRPSCTPHFLLLLTRSVNAGGAAAKFACQAVHKKLVAEPAYREKQWAAALKAAFLNADTELRSGMRIAWTCVNRAVLLMSVVDPGHARDPSGCTAVGTLITSDGKLICVSLSTCLATYCFLTSFSRQTPVTRVP